MIRNPYEILGIREGASMDEIKRAYRKKAKEFHPDLHPDDPRANEKMQQVNEAYDMLCNPDKYRQQARPNPYGQYGQNNYGGNTGHGYGSYANQGGYANQRQQGNWQYTYYTNGQNPWGDGQSPWTSWQDMWNNASNEQQYKPIRINPFRGIVRLVGGILLFRFIISLLRFGLFGFFF